MVSNTARDIIFLFDRSGSMCGKPWEQGACALETALNKMRPEDRFGIACFDHEMNCFSTGAGMELQHGMEGGLFQINQENTSLAKQWIKQNKARGLTDILTPLIWASKVLQNNCRPNRMQFIVLITDGAVTNEREIVEALERQTKDIRVLTFGIGSYCNWYFLKMLALKTRGWNSGAVMVEDIDKRMDRMLDSASVPVLRDVQIDISGVKEVELYPPRIPDLFAGRPIILAGEVSGDRFPEQVVLDGVLSNGQKRRLRAETESPETEDIPLKRIFIKQQIDQLVAEHWLHQDPKMEEELVKLSVNENMPTPYSHMVAFEVTPEQKEEFDTNKKEGGKGWSGGKIAAVGAGIVVVGTGAFMLGNVAATAAGGSSVLEGFGDGLFEAMGGEGGCDCFGDCGGCPECGEIGETIGKCCEGVGEYCGNAVETVGDACQNIGDCCGNLIGGIGDACQGIGDACQDIGECCGNAGEGIGELVGFCRQVCDECL